MVVGGRAKIYVVVAVIIIVVSIALFYIYKPYTSPSTSGTSSSKNTAYPTTQALSTATSIHTGMSSAKTMISCRNLTIVEGVVYSGEKPPRLVITLKNMNPARIHVTRIGIVELNISWNIDLYMIPGILKTLTLTINTSNIPYNRLTIRITYSCNNKTYSVQSYAGVVGGK